MMPNLPVNILVRGAGVVSPAGWGIAPLREALARGEPVGDSPLERPGWDTPFRVRRVPALAGRPAFRAHARLRRASSIAQYTVAAALEALGGDADRFAGGGRLGLVYCALCGCVNYSRRFYDEILRDPATASPLIFPETVHNSPASHLASFLGTAGINYTLIGDQAAFVQGIVLAADWLLAGLADACLVIGAEELDWLTSDAMRHFSPETILSEGAGALYLRRSTDAEAAVQLGTITDAQPFSGSHNRACAARIVREELAAGAPDELLCDGRQDASEADYAERMAWNDWPGARVSPKIVLGEAFTAAAAWQCAVAVDALSKNQYAAATVSVVGSNDAAIAARFQPTGRPPTDE